MQNVSESIMNCEKVKIDAVKMKSTHLHLNTLEGVGVFPVQRGALVGVELVLAAPPVHGVEAVVAAHQVEAAGQRHVVAHLRGLRHHQLNDLHRLVAVRPHTCRPRTYTHTPVYTSVPPLYIYN